MEDPVILDSSLIPVLLLAWIPSRDDHTKLQNCPDSVEMCEICSGPYSATLAYLVKGKGSSFTWAANIANEWLPCTNIWEVHLVSYF